MTITPRFADVPAFTTGGIPIIPFHRCLVLSLVAASSAAWAAEPPPAVAQPDTLTAEAERILAASYADDAPGAAVIVTRKGEMIYAGARGLTDTVFRVGSDLLDLIRSRPAKAAPGAEWEYNNGGYVILGAIVEHLTGHSWNEEVARRIARPLGLATLIDAVSADGLPATARFYGMDGDRFVSARGALLSLAHAAGNLAMSVADSPRGRTRSIRG